ncbi:hypothetical protein SAY86_002508 [Trapa natans]|uniref:Protein kinase domain-containing protein n=1 Tax=Trapa natans TaxID=22666 RepID=A0AAN7LKC6_TRANT|nr:hypothetical protein SAY86_002508 [Trapa natans]
MKTGNNNMELQLLAASLLLLVFLPATAPDLAADRAALMSLRSAVGGRSLLWPVAANTTPCSWTGVHCESGRVTVLRLPGASLSGQLPVSAFLNLTRLRTLSLRLNSLAGPLPDLSACTSLRNLYLQGNAFNGKLPDSLFTIHGLVRLNLASNNLIGPVSDDLNGLPRLRTLFLQNNRLTGPIPAGLKLPKLEQLNISNNLLTGSVPESLQSFTRASFSGNSLCGKPLDSCAAEDIVVPSEGANKDSDNNNRKKLSGSAVAGIAIGSVFAFFIVVIVSICLCRKGGNKRRTGSLDIFALNKQQEMGLKAAESKELESPENGGGLSSNNTTAEGPEKMMANGGGGGGPFPAKKLIFFRNAPRVFDLEDLLRASAEVLGKGTFGTAYKAVMEVGMAVAVKRLKDVIVSPKEFQERIEEVGAMSHENLVPPRAYYYSNDEKLLVHDFMSMGSLSALLHGNKGAGRTPLSWEIRSSIALGAARGIEHLHSRGPTVSHGNIKSSNILLTKTYEARVSDFGLAHLVGPSSTPTRVLGYRAPEVTDPCRTTQKADVYSFGILLLELLTGKAPTHSVLNEEGVDLPRWVQSVVQDEWTSEVFDLELLRYQSVEKEMVQLLQLAIDCAAQYPDSRPSMAEVRRQIEEICHSSSRDHMVPNLHQGINVDASSQ